MEKVVMKLKRVERIIKDDQASHKRRIQPTKYFSDLQALIETFHPGYRLVSHDSNIRCVLKVAGTDELVGSQFELFCAYQDAVSDTLTLDLELHLKERKNLKRIADEFYEDEVEEDGNKDWAKVGKEVFAFHTGRWSNSEAELFGVGVAQQGWGEWAKISDIIQTRDRAQVFKFSLSQRAKRVFHLSLICSLKVQQAFLIWLKDIKHRHKDLKLYLKHWWRKTARNSESSKILFC
jgi:hypothetical protein